MFKTKALSIQLDIGHNGGQHVLFYGESQCSPGKVELERMGREWGIPEPQTVVEEVFEAVKGWKEEFAAFGVPEKDIRRLKALDLAID